MTIGEFVSGSTIKPLMLISICMAAPSVVSRRSGRSCSIRLPASSVNAGVAGNAVDWGIPRRRKFPRVPHGSPDAMSAGPLNAHPHGPSDPFRRPWKIDDDVLARAPGELGLAPSAGRVDQHVDFP